MAKNYMPVRNQGNQSRLISLKLALHSIEEPVWILSRLPFEICHNFWTILWNVFICISNKAQFYELCRNLATYMTQNIKIIIGYHGNQQKTQPKTLKITKTRPTSHLNCSKNAQIYAHFFLSPCRFCFQEYENGY